MICGDVLTSSVAARACAALVPFLAVGLATACVKPDGTSFLGPGDSDHGSDGSTDSTGSGGADSSDHSTGTDPKTCVSDEDCPGGDVCSGFDRCSENNVCVAGEPPQEPTSCGDGRMCVDGECLAAVCGNGIIEPGEHCDDGNLANFDGCDAFCQYEVFYRTYELTLMPSPAGSFCDRPNSALGDALSSFALEANNAERKVNIDTGAYSSISQIIGLRDLSGTTDATVELRSATGMPDPARGTWPTDGSNPLDWWFMVDQESLAPDGELADRMTRVPLSGGAYIGGPGISLRALPEFLDSTTRARFDYSTDPDVPAAPPEMLDEGLVVPREIIGDGPDEGVCGNLTVAFLASVPADPTLEDCLECPGTSRTYTACSGDVVTDDCNSALDPLVGGCVIGPNCLAGFEIVLPTQPDVDHGGAGTLMNDPNHLNKVPSSATAGNLDGYSSYFRFRARRVQVTGTL
jgi:cysteine-rich repeat protein